MEPTDAKRRLSAILMSDVAGYSRLMGEDEQATLRTLTAHREVFRTQIERHDGRVVNAPGDSILAEFGSVVDAVACAAEIQRELAEKNAELPTNRAMHFRIGINLGDVLFKDDAIYGDGVNIAARLESLADPGGIAISRSAFDQVEGKLPLFYEYIGEQQVKNIAKPVRTYKVLSQPGAAAHRVVRASRLAARIGERKGKLIGLAASVLLVAALAVAGVYFTGPSSPLAPEDDPILAMPTGPTIAVLPFVNISGDPEQEYFSDGLTEEIITELSRFTDLHVLSRNSTFQYKGQAVDVRQIGKELGANYLLEGSVRREGKRIRVTAQLIDAADGKHAWAETYDRELTGENLFQVQDEITAGVVGAIGGAYGAISRARMEASKGKPPERLDAYDCVLRAAVFIRQLMPDLHGPARDCLETAVEREPEYAEAWAWLGWMYISEHAYGYNPRANPLDRALEAAQRAVALGPQNQSAHWSLAAVHYFRHDRAFFGKAERAIALNPNNTEVVGPLCLYIVWAGQWERGVNLCRKVIELDPHYPNWIHWPAGTDAYRRGEYRESLEIFEKWEIPGFFYSYHHLAQNYGQLNMRDEAQDAVAKLLELYPNFGAHVRRELHKWFWEEDVIEHEIEGLRKAGLEVPEEGE